MEDYKTSDEYHVPMSVQHTEALLEEIDRMVTSSWDLHYVFEHIYICICYVYIHVLFLLLG